MIYYDLISGDSYSGTIRYRPRTCFIMTQLRAPIPPAITNIRRNLKQCLRERDLKSIDANSLMTGKDFLNKIWDTILSVPLGIGIICSEMTINAKLNVFYEIGLMQALGKETLIIKTEDSEVPSDFVRTEYIDYSRGFGNKVDKFLNTFFELATYYSNMADGLEQNPLLAIDYLKRAYLITADPEYKKRIIDIVINSSSFDNYSKDSIKNLLKF